MFIMYGNIYKTKLDLHNITNVELNALCINTKKPFWLFCSRFAALWCDDIISKTTANFLKINKIFFYQPNKASSIMNVSETAIITHA